MTTSLYQAIKSLEYNFRYGKTQWPGYNRTWHIDWWDGRTAAVKQLKAAGINRQDAAAILNKIVSRRKQKEAVTTPSVTHQERLRFLALVKECTYDPTAQSSRYNCTGIDWKAFHRASSNGKGWVLIAPDEPGNNWYMEDALLVKYLSKKYKA